MKSAIVCLFGLLMGWQIGSMAAAQEPNQLLAGSLALPCDKLTNATGDGHTHSLSCKLVCLPARCCCDDYNAHPFPRSCARAYSPWYRCVPAADLSCSTSACTNNEKRTWWFIPNCHALKEALWLD
ncbi:MAG: hypothetical protein ABI557_12980 [Aureliella sp.]